MTARGVRVLADRATDGGTAYDVALDEDSPYFRDHFPGRPILPAIAQLDILALLLHRASPGVRIAGIERMNLRSTILPGDRLTVTLERSSGERRRFTITRGAETLSDGVLLVAETRPA